MPEPIFEEVAALRKKFDRAKEDLSEFHFNQMGNLLGETTVGKFPNLLALQSKLDELLKDPLLVNGTSSEAKGALEFLRLQRKNVDLFKADILSKMEVEEKSINIKQLSENRAGTPNEYHELQGKLLGSLSGFSMLHHTLTETINNLNDAFAKDVSKVDSRRQLAKTVLSIVLGLASASALTELPEVISNLQKSLDDATTKKVITASATEVQRRLEDAVKDLDKDIAISPAFHDAIDWYIDSVSARENTKIQEALKLIRELSLTDWDNQLKILNEQFLLQSMTPQFSALLVQQVLVEMERAIRQERVLMAVAALANIPSAMNKVIKLASLSDRTLMDAEVAPIREFFQLRLLTSILIREYSNLEYTDNLYNEVSNAPAHTGYTAMRRSGRVKYFPDEIKNLDNGVILLMLTKPNVKTGPLKKDEAVHKGGSKTREVFATQISGIKDNLALYGYAAGGEIVSPGTMEDTLRSYSIIFELMQTTSGATDQATIPIFKEDSEVLAAITAILQYNIFFETHEQNNGNRLVTPLCVFVNDKHLVNLIETRPELKENLNKLMTEDFILKCLTDFNIRGDMQGNNRDHNRLTGTLLEMTALLKICGATPAEVLKIQSKAEQYIVVQCNKAVIPQNIKDCKAKIDAIDLVKLRQSVPGDGPTLATFLEKLKAQPDTISIQEYEDGQALLVSVKNRINTDPKLKDLSKSLSALAEVSVNLLDNRKSIANFDASALSVVVPPSPTSTISTQSSPSSTSPTSTVSQPTTPTSTASPSPTSTVSTSTASPPTTPTSTAVSPSPSPTTSTASTSTASPPTTPTPVVSPSTSQPSPTVSPVSSTTRQPPGPPAARRQSIAPPPPSTTLAVAQTLSGGSPAATSASLTTAPPAPDAKTPPPPPPSPDPKTSSAAPPPPPPAKAPDHKGPPPPPAVSVIKRP